MRRQIFKLFIIFSLLISPVFANNITVDNSETSKKEPRKNIIVKESDRIISESTRKINAFYPEDLPYVTNNFPGYRGANQLVIYTKNFGKTKLEDLHFLIPKHSLKLQ